MNFKAAVQWSLRELEHRKEPKIKLQFNHKQNKLQLPYLSSRYAGLSVHPQIQDSHVVRSSRGEIIQANIYFA
jgi:hypothetical protein